MKKILVIGSLNMDLKVTMVRMPAEGETLMGKKIEYHAGGKGANQAVAAGRLGGNVTMLGALGWDEFGEVLMQSLISSGVDIKNLIRKEQPTGTAVIFVDANGKNSIVVIPSANADCDLSYLVQHQAIIEESDYLLLQMEIPHDAVWHAVKEGHRMHKTVILNPAPAPDHMTDDLLAMVDWLTPNESELAALSGLPCENLDQIKDAANSLIRRGARQIIVTVGRHGAMWVNEAGARLFSVLDTPVIDTTAAGDCFNAAFTLAISEGKNPEEAITFANAAATLSVARAGAQSSLPTRAEVDAFLARQLSPEPTEPR